MKKHLRIIAALLALVSVAFLCCSGIAIKELLSKGGPNPLKGDITADPNYDLATLQPSANEAGLMAMDIWEDDLGAFRTCTRKEAADHWRVLFVEDNTMMLWAMSKGMYKWSHEKGYGVAIRDYILSQIKDDTLGTFYMGQYSDTAGENYANSIDQPEGLSFVYEDPYVPFMPLWGVIAYTIAYPQQAGEYSAEYYHNYISMLLENQASLVGDSNYPQENNSSSLAFYMASCANWYDFTGEEKYLEYAKEAYRIIRGRVTDDGIIENEHIDVLRHVETVWGLYETYRAVGNFEDLYDIYVRTRDQVHISEEYGKGLYLTEDYRSDYFDDSKCHQLQIAYGYYYLAQEDYNSEAAQHAYQVMLENRLNIGTEDTEAYAYGTWVTDTENNRGSTGCIEGNAMAYLMDWWKTMLESVNAG